MQPTKVEEVIDLNLTFKPKYETKQEYRYIYKYSHNGTFVRVIL